MDYEQVLRTESAKEFRLPKGVSEDNWKSRMSFCNNLTDAINNYGHDRLPKDFTIQIEPFLNNILDCAISERTQLSNSACRLLEKLPEVLEKDMHPHLDRILPVLLKLCANTKQVTVKVAASAVTGILKFSTYSPRLLWHVCQVFEDKPAGPKIHATLWIQTILKDYHRQVDLHKDGRMLSRAINLALEDADSQVRTKSRATYWTYSRFDPDGAQDIMEKLNNHAKTALQNDPSNPDKKSGAVQKEPPRPRSALADVRKEQAKKKRAEEEKQKKTFNMSTVSQDAIEIHEPRKDRPQKPERQNTSKTTSTERTIDATQSALRPSVNPPAHKKVLSQDNEVVSKPSASSRLLSAPVRRPRINVTPMNTTQTSRPSSRTGNAVQPKEKEPQKDSRPTSSSSWKSASIGAGAVTSPKLKATTVTVPKSKSIPSPTFRTHFVPEGKENTPAPPLKPKRSPPMQVSAASKLHSNMADVPEETKVRYPEINEAMEKARAYKARLEADHLAKARIPFDLSAAENRTTAHEHYDADNQRENHETFATTDNSSDIPKEAKPKVTTSKTRTRRDDARRYLKTTLEEGRFARNKLDALELRKLKHILECYPEDLLQDEDTYNRLIETMCYALGSIEDINQDGAQSKSLYCRGLILQMSMPLLNNYRAWSWKYWSLWIECMIYYRCTLTTDASDRQVRYLRQSISEVINHHQNPLEFIDSVTTAIYTAEPILLRAVNDHETALSKQGKLRHGGMAEMEGMDKPVRGQPLAVEETSFTAHATWNPYSTQSQWKGVIEEKVDDSNIQHVKDYMKNALNEYNFATIDPDRPYPKTLPLLWDFSLDIYTLILTRANDLGDSLQSLHEIELCTIASHCLASYDYMVKKAVVQFVKVLYTIINNEDRFFDHFKDENQQNLLEYYVFDSKR